VYEQHLQQHQQQQQQQQPLMSWKITGSPSAGAYTIKEKENSRKRREAEALVPTELPWTSSVAAGRELSYNAALKEQLRVIAALNMECVSVDERFVFQSSTIKPARIGNLCFKSEHFRKVRLTYFDAGDSVQVFNALWYPAYEYDAPLFGVDLISLGKNRVLTVVDTQPLHPTPEYCTKYISHLTDIRNKYPDLHGVLSGKIYDDTSFFSKNMLFGRFTDESKLDSVVVPAHAEYLAAYTNMVTTKARPDYMPASKEAVRVRQQAYDVYSAAKDPAVGLFDAYFGKEWSDAYVHQFLFSLTQPDEAGLGGVVIPQEQARVHNFKLDQSGNPILPETRRHQ